MSDQFTFTYTATNEDGDPTDRVTKVITGDLLTHCEVAERFSDFLRGCGYVFSSHKTHGLVKAR